MKDEKKAPKLRFKGFTDDWEQCKLGDVAEIVGGGTPSTKKSEYWNGNINWFSPAEIGNQIFVSHSQKQITELGLMKSSAKILPAGTILFTSRAGIGNTAILTRNACTNQGFQSIVPYSKKLDSYFIYSESAKLKRYGETMGSGSTFTEVSGKQMKKMSLHIPNINEQAKIGNMLKILDQTITLHEEKKRQFERIKSALLKKVFTDKSGYPAVRFKGFDDEWKQFMLGDVAKITMGQSPNSKNYTDNPKDRILVQGNADMKDGQVHPKIWTTEITKTANKGDLILSVRAPVGDIGKTSYDVVIGRGVAAIKGNEFIFQLLKRMKAVGYWTKYSTGSTFESINSLEINNAVINLPKEHEQNEVGNILSYMDHAITLQNYKIELIKKLKSSFLQKMFI
jgi:type I restriction enzyme S subunit